MLKRQVAREMVNGQGAGATVVSALIFYSILLSHLEVNWSQITTLPRYRYTLHQHVWKFPEIHGSLKEDYIQIQLFSKHGCEGLSERLKYTSFVTELIKNMRTENMNQQKGACGHLLELPHNSFHGLPGGQVEEEEDTLFTVNMRSRSHIRQKVFCKGSLSSVIL